MPERSIVLDTGALLALLGGLGELDLLRQLYDEAHVPFEVCREVEAGGATGFGVEAFVRADWLLKSSSPSVRQGVLSRALDPGEASVIQLALDRGIDLVCIDELAGRRMARLAGLRVTGSVGVLIRAKREGKLPEIRPVLERMQARGVFLAPSVVAFALNACGETPRP